MPRYVSALVLGLALSVAACAAGQGDDPASPPAPEARLEIDNRSSLDMDIYVRNDRGNRTRIGLAPAGQATAFALPRGVLVGSVAFRFEARPVRGQGRSVVSEPYQVRPGGLIVWSVPPQ